MTRRIQFWHISCPSPFCFNAMTDEDEFESIADAGEAESASMKRSTTTRQKLKQYNYLINGY